MYWRVKYASQLLVKNNTFPKKIVTTYLMDSDYFIWVSYSPYHFRKLKNRAEQLAPTYNEGRQVQKGMILMMSMSMITRG